MSEEEKVESSFSSSPDEVCLAIFLSGMLMGAGFVAACLGGVSPLEASAGKLLVVVGWIAVIAAFLFQIPIIYLVAQLRRKD